MTTMAENSTQQEIAKAGTAIGEALQTLRERLATIEAAQREKMEAREQYRHAPVTREEAMAVLEEDLTRFRGPLDEGRDEIARIAGRARNGRPHDQLSGRPQRVEVEGVIIDRNINTGNQPRAGALMYLLADSIRKAFREALDADERFDSPYVVPAPDREKRIRELDAEIDNLESERQGLLDELRKAGFGVQEKLEEVTE